MSIKHGPSPKSNRKAPLLLLLCPGARGRKRSCRPCGLLEKREALGLPHLHLNVPSAGDPAA